MSTLNDLDIALQLKLRGQPSPDFDHLVLELLPGLLQSATVIIEINGGLIDTVVSDKPARVLIMDADIEGGDEDKIMVINGEDRYVHDHQLYDHTGIDENFVGDIVGQIDSKSPAPAI